MNQQQDHNNNSSGENVPETIPIPSSGGPIALENGGVGDQMQDIGLFSTRKPKDIGAGISSGLKNITKGIGAGLGALVVTPFVAAAEEMNRGDPGNRALNGAVGFVKGLGIGLLGAVTLPIAGAATGLYQISRGVANQGEAWTESRQGNEWDSKRRKWITYILRDEAELVLNETEEKYFERLRKESMEDRMGAAATAKKLEADKIAKEEGGGGGGVENAKTEYRPTRQVKDTEFYELLGVDTNANGAEIKKAYYKRARTLHPDKNPDDPQAAEKFQKVGNAYQVLSNEQLRAKYDKHGKDSVADAPVMDSSAFFAMIFGSEKFEPIVGELQLATLMGLGADPTSAETMVGGDDKISKTLEYTQNKREVQIAVNLAKTLDVYIQDENAFKEEMEKEAKELAANGFGATLLNVVGYVYEEQAMKHAGFRHSVIAGLGISEVRRRAHILNNKVRVAHSVYKAYQTTKGLEKKMKEVEKNIKEEQGKSNATATTEETSNGEGGTTAGEKKAELTEEEIKRMSMKKVESEFAGESMGVLIETLWNYSVLDIEGTLRKACHKIFYDRGVTEEIRMKRADGLLLLSEIYQKYGQSTDVGLNEFRDKLQAEMKAAQTVAEHQAAAAAAAASENNATDNEEETSFNNTSPKPAASSKKKPTSPKASVPPAKKKFTETELKDMKPKEMKNILELKGIDYSDCIEKSDFVRKILENQ